MILLISLAAILVIAGAFALKPVKAHGIELVAEEQAQLLPSGDTADFLSQYRITLTCGRYNYGTLTPKMYNSGISMKKTVAQIYAAVDDSNYQ